MKIVTILGARPQFIKAATLSRVFKMAGIDEIIVHTGQHYDQNMSDIFFSEMQIPKPNYQLKIASKYHGEMTGKMLAEVEQVMIKETPDVALVYGDTNSTLAGALAASKLHIPVAHVEAGLRSFNRRMPEEVNRVLTDHISNWLFAPTDVAIKNLKNEGIQDQLIYRVGDVMYDAILHYQKISDSQSKVIRDLELEGVPFILATIHRAENTNSPELLAGIINALAQVSREKVIVFPVHPRTRALIATQNLPIGLRIIDPVGYLDMIQLQKNCRLIVTDSGGVQKEAYLNKKYCVTVRNETEWVELLNVGVNFLAKADDINPLIQRLWNEPFHADDIQLYGDGRSAEQIVSLLTR